MCMRHSNNTLSSLNMDLSRIFWKACNTRGIWNIPAESTASKLQSTTSGACVELTRKSLRSCTDGCHWLAWSWNGMHAFVLLSALARSLCHFFSLPLVHVNIDYLRLINLEVNEFSTGPQTHWRSNGLSNQLITSLAQSAWPRTQTNDDTSTAGSKWEQI